MLPSANPDRAPRHLWRRPSRAAEIIKKMQAESLLLQYLGESSWQLSDGSVVAPQTAKAIVARRDIVDGGDTLFPAPRVRKATG